jgi:hypothetical protein
MSLSIRDCSRPAIWRHVPGALLKAFSMDEKEVNKIAERRRLERPIVEGAHDGRPSTETPEHWRDRAWSEDPLLDALREHHGPSRPDLFRSKK